MEIILLTVQIISGILLSGLILMQVRGTGFGRVWGGLSSSFSRRGLEQLVFKLTFIVGFLFITVSAVAVII